MTENDYSEIAEDLRNRKKGGTTKKEKAKEKKSREFKYPPCSKKSCFANSEGKCIILNTGYKTNCPFYKRKGVKHDNANDKSNFRRTVKGQPANTGRRFEQYLSKRG